MENNFRAIGATTFLAPIPAVMLSCRGTEPGFDRDQSDYCGLGRRRQQRSADGKRLHPPFAPLLRADSAIRAHSA